MKIHTPSRSRNRSRDRHGHEASTVRQFSKKKGGRDEQLEEDMQVDRETIATVPNPAYVGVNAAATINLGNYESMKIGISISRPCLPTDKAIKRMYRKVAKTVARLVKQEEDYIRGE